MIDILDNPSRSIINLYWNEWEGLLKWFLKVFYSGNSTSAVLTLHTPVSMGSVSWDYQSDSASVQVCVRVSLTVWCRLELDGNKDLWTKRHHRQQTKRNGKRRRLEQKTKIKIKNNNQKTLLHYLHLHAEEFCPLPPDWLSERHQPVTYQSGMCGFVWTVTSSSVPPTSSPAPLTHHDRLCHMTRREPQVDHTMLLVLSISFRDNKRQQKGF